MILQFSPDNSKCVVYKVMINVDLKLGGYISLVKTKYFDEISQISRLTTRRTKIQKYSHLWQPVTRAGGNPLLVDVIVDHHAGAGGRDTLLGSLVTGTGNIRLLNWNILPSTDIQGWDKYLCLPKLHQTKDDIKYLNGRLRLEDNVSVVASPTINGLPLSDNWPTSPSFSLNIYILKNLIWCLMIIN